MQNIMGYASCVSPPAIESSSSNLLWNSLGSEVAAGGQKIEI